MRPQDGFLLLDKDKFAASFAADLTADVHGERAGALGVKALDGTISEAAWRTKPSCYLIATEDRMIPPPAQRLMAERGLDGR